MCYAGRQVRQELERMQWTGFDTHTRNCCPSCKHFESEGHAKLCPIKKMVDMLKGETDAEGTNHTG